MFLNSPKVPGIIIGPENPDRLSGSWLYLTTMLRIRRIHCDELTHHNDRPITITQNRKSKYLAFDRVGGGMLIVLAEGKNSSKCIVCGTYSYLLTPIANVDIEKAPPNFYYKMYPKHSINAYLQGLCIRKSCTAERAYEIIIQTYGDYAKKTISSPWKSITDIPNSWAVSLFHLL